MALKIELEPRSLSSEWAAQLSKLQAENRDEARIKEKHNRQASGSYPHLLVACCGTWPSTGASNGVEKHISALRLIK